MKQSELQTRLQDISLAMSDAYYFIQVRLFLESLNIRAENGDESAKKIMQIVSQFDELVKFATTTKI